MRLQTQSQWEAERLAYVPTQWAADFLRQFERKKKNEPLRTANEWLRVRTDAFQGLRIPLDSTDADICDMARKRAADVMGLAHGCFGLEDYRQRAASYCQWWGIAPPEPLRTTRRGKVVGVADRPAIARMTDHEWWRRKLRTVHGRALEAEAIRMGYVHRRDQIYASDITVEQRQQQKRRNALALEATEAINKTTGEVFNLLELAQRAVSNPTIRRGELMVRIAGFEAVAKALGHVGEFFTVTCPSRFHPKKTSARTGSVWENPKYDGSTPREAQAYLTGMWAKLRAALERRGVAWYGFRVVEPHHDATPHWHLLMFFAPEWRRKIIGLFCRYARKADARELDTVAARRARFHAKPIDWSKGSAAGYIAKYIAKNIDGYQVQTDLEGDNLDAVTGSMRVEAWASRWRIRQFQQVGGPPVGVWRELRKLQDKDTTPTVEAARSAADVGNWQRYVEVQGGPTVTRKQLALRTAYTRAGERFNAEVGACEPAPLTRYGELAPGAIYGVKDARMDRAFPTRLFQWEIRRGGDVLRKGLQVVGRVLETGGGKVVGQRICLGSHVGSVDRIGFYGVGDEGVGCFGSLGSPKAAPWSPVNNCTERCDGAMSGGGRLRGIGDLRISESGKSGERRILHRGAGDLSLSNGGKDGG